MSLRDEQEEKLDIDFAVWKDEHQESIDALKVTPGHQVWDYQLICNGHRQSVLKDEGLVPCNETIRYRICNGQLYVVEAPETSSIFGLSSNFLKENANRLLYRRIVPYLLTKGCLMCERCGRVHKVL